MNAETHLSPARQLLHSNRHREQNSAEGKALRLRGMYARVVQAGCVVVEDKVVKR